MAEWPPQAIENTYRWRVGSHVGRTIYACPPGSAHREGEYLIGVMDSPEIAQAAVDAHNIIRRMWEDAMTREQIEAYLCDCSCHQVVQPGLIPCPNCEHSSRYGRHD